MKTSLSRRDLLKFVGGSVAGVMFTPIPWKLLDDTAIWTQNWSWIPTPLKGELKTRFTTCTLCPAGCGVRARCIGAQPVALLPVTGHPAGTALCPVGLTGHHLMYLPSRVRTPVRLQRKGDPTSVVGIELGEALGAVAAAVKSAGRGSVAIIDGQHGRMTSLLYRKFIAEEGNGYYVVSPSPDRMGLTTMESSFEAPPGSLWFDAEHARTIVSFGAPLLDGWGSTSRSTAIVRNLHSQDDRRLHLVQVEPRQSHTASGATEWFPLRPGTEGVLALGIANVLVTERLYARGTTAQAKDFESFVDLVGAFDPVRVAAVTGIDAEKIRNTARLLARRAPSLAVSGGDGAFGGFDRGTETAIMSLNFLLGSVGEEGGVTVRREVPSPTSVTAKHVAKSTDFRDIPDHSLSLLILDSAESGSTIPWRAIEQKLTGASAVVVSFSPVAAGHALHADYIIPSPAYLESYEESTVMGSPRPAFALSAGFFPPPPGVVEPAEFIQRLAAKTGRSLEEGDSFRTHEALLKQRVAGLRRMRRGTVFNLGEAKEVPITSFASDDDLWKAMVDGAVWIDAHSRATALPRFSLRGSKPDSLQSLRRILESPQNEGAITLIAFGMQRVARSGNVSPLLSKLFQESELHSSGGVVYVHPETASRSGVSNGDEVLLETSAGSTRARVRCTKSVIQGAAFIEAGPAGAGDTPAELCVGEHGCNSAEVGIRRSQH